MQSAETKAADGGSGGTTISIAVYRSSFPIAKWDLNDQDFNLTKAEWAWADRTAELPKDASPGSEVVWPESGKPADYAEPKRAGFEFAGWSTDKSASAGGYIDGSSPKLTMPEGAPEAKSYTLYALWTPLEYSVVFELAKNPEANGVDGIVETAASFKLNWDSADGVRTVTSLGDGRFRVDGFTMKEADYDEVTRTVGLSEPSRTGYRFLGWSEPDGQSLAMDNAAKDGFALNPVRLTQIDGTPVLTARWASAFGVTAPLSITFGDYDKTGAPGNPWLGDKGSNAADDTTQSEADDTTKSEQEGYAKGGQAYFENTGWHEAVKLVGLTSERHASANQVLTTYDSKLASEAAVLGDGTEANPGERLLSLYPSAPAPADKSSGVHFRLTDALDETALGSAFTMAPQGEEGAKKEISYGLNLSTDPADGSANHGLVLPTNDYERKQIATVSYTFATATAAEHDPYLVKPSGAKDALYIEVPQSFLDANGLADTVLPGTYGLSAIEAAADDIASKVTVQPPATGASDDQVGAYWDTVQRQASASRYYGLYRALLAAQVTSSGNPGSGPYFKVKVDGAYLDLQLIGIAQDTRSDGAGKAGLSFQMRDVFASGNMTSEAAGQYEFPCFMNPTNDNAGGWEQSKLRSNLRDLFGSRLDPALQSAITKVAKFQQAPGGTDEAHLQKTTNMETVWIPSLYETHGVAFSDYNASEGLTTVPGYAPFQYLAYQGNDGSTVNDAARKAYDGSTVYLWLRSAVWRANLTFCCISPGGRTGVAGTEGLVGIAPCFSL